MTKKLTPTMENYLEAILTLEAYHGHAHIKDIAESLGVKKPSATEVLKKLKKAGLIFYQPYGTITLAKAGKEAAQCVFNCHCIVGRFLHEVLKVDKKTAEQEACQIEHVISDKTLAKIKKFLEGRK